MRQYRFTVLVMLDPAAGENAMRCGQSTARACCLVEPSCYTYFFPAVIETEEEQPQQGVPRALMTTTLSDSEAARSLQASDSRFGLMRWSATRYGPTG